MTDPNVAPDVTSSTPDQPSDVDIELTRIQLERAQAGDEGALWALLSRHEGPLKRVIRMRLGRQLGSQADVDDVVHDVYGIALDQLHKLEHRGPGRFLSWLTKVASHQIIQQVRAQQAVKRGGIIASLNVGADASDSDAIDPAARSSASPSNVASKAEMQQIVDGLVSRLEGDEYEVITLCNYFHLSTEEAAVELDRSVSATRSLYARAKRRLRSMAAPYIEEA